MGCLAWTGPAEPGLQQARGGTLLLEHLHSLAMPVQKELVSVLRNNGQNFRLICTSDEDLEKLTDEGRFNDELFYRVAALPVAMAPLRERLEDLPILIKHFTRGVSNPHFDTALVEFSEDAMAQIRTYRWPGNLAELEQVVSRIVSTSEARVITSQQLPLRLREADQWPKLADYLAGQEKQLHRHGAPCVWGRQRPCSAGAGRWHEQVELGAGRTRSDTLLCRTSPERDDEGAPFPLAPRRAARTLRAIYAMPKRTDLNSILIIGAGPIVIGQACEFDYSGTQACKALKEEGYRVVLVNSNPATIMTDPEFADVTYIEPLTIEFSRRSSRPNVPRHCCQRWADRPP